MFSPSRIELSAQALRKNIEALRATCPGKEAIAVVKANAYGHGMKETVRIVEPLVDALQVDDMIEARELKTLTQKRILVLGSVPSWEWEEAVKLGVELALYRDDMLHELNRLGGEQGVRVPVHVKIDALLGRQGLLPQEANTFLEQLKTCEHILLSGVYMHFSDVEDTEDPGHALAQWAAFSPIIEIAQEQNPQVNIHASATGAVLAHDAQLPTTAIRLGIGMYGLWPSTRIRERHEMRVPLAPVLRWVSYVAQVKEVPAGFPIGYGRTFIAPKPMRIAVVPQGYSDGYDRGLSSRGMVLVRGKRCSVLGRVAMNMCVVDITDVPEVQAEDEVVLLGNQGNDAIAAEEVAQAAQSINYEIVARLSPLLPRYVVR